MTTSLEQIHDLASRRNRLDVEVDASPAYDLLLAMWSAFGGDDKVAAHDLGRDWFERFRAGVPAAATERMASFGGDAGDMWATLVGYLAARLPGRDMSAAAVIDWLAAADLAPLRREVLEELAWKAAGDPDGWEGEVEAALRGDDDALARILDSLPESMQRKRAGHEAFLGGHPDLAAEVSEVLAAVHEAVYGRHESEWTPALAASAEEVRREVGSADPVELIERITNGITYRIPLGTTRLVLVPSVTMRPWTLVTEHAGTIVVVYPVADEHLGADPEAPPSWLVKIHKALGDERRLRMLRRIAEGEAGLAELTEMVGLAKSTVFHHIGVLRAAGLVGVRMGEGESVSYTLRRSSLDEAGALLDRYLRPEGEEGATG